MPHEKEYSVIPIGDGGLCILIPRGWARYYKIRPKDKLTVISNGKLIIEPPKKNSDSEEAKT